MSCPPTFRPYADQTIDSILDGGYSAVFLPSEAAALIDGDELMAKHGVFPSHAYWWLDPAVRDQTEKRGRDAIQQFAPKYSIVMTGMHRQGRTPPGHAADATWMPTEDKHAQRLSMRLAEGNVMHQPGPNEVDRAYAEGDVYANFARMVADLLTASWNMRQPMVAYIPSGSGKTNLLKYIKKHPGTSILLSGDIEPNPGPHCHQYRPSPPPETLPYNTIHPAGEWARAPQLDRPSECWKSICDALFAVAVTVLLALITALLLRSGDVERNPGPPMDKDFGEAPNLAGAVANTVAGLVAPAVAGVGSALLAHTEEATHALQGAADAANYLLNTIIMGSATAPPPTPPGATPSAPPPTPPLPQMPQTQPHLTPTQAVARAGP